METKGNNSGFRELLFRGFNSSRWVWLFPFFLSILPLFTAHLALERFRRNLTEQMDEAWLSKTDAIVSRTVEFSNKTRWFEEIGNRFRQRIEARLQKTGNRPNIARAFQNSLKKAFFKNFSPRKIWAFDFHQSNLSKRPLLIRAPEFETDRGALLSSLFHSIALNMTASSTDKPDNLKSEAIGPGRLMTSNWRNLLEMIFGLPNGHEFFQQEMRCRAFNAVFDHRPVIIVWDIVMVAGSPAGAFMMLFDFPDRFACDPAQALIDNWANKVTFPAFISYPNDCGRAHQVRYFHKVLKNPEIFRILGEIQSDMEIEMPVPGREGTQVNLPTYLTGRALKQDGWRFRVFPLTRESGYLALLFSKVEPLKLHWIDHGLWVWSVIVLIFWLMVALRSFIFGEFPNPGIRMDLLLRFLGLAALPILSILASNAGYLFTLELNMTDRLNTQMMQAIRRIETESGELFFSQRKSCTEMISDPALLDKLKLVRSGSVASGSLMDELWTSARERGIALKALTVVGHNNFGLTQDDLKSDPRVRTWLLNLMYQSLEIALLSQKNNDEKMPDDKPLEKIPEGCSYTLKQSGTNKVMDAILRDYEGSRAFVAHRIYSGNRRFMTFEGPVKESLRKVFMIGMLWEQGYSYREFLRKKIDELSETLSEGGVKIEISAFGKSANRIEPIAVSEKTAGLADIAARAAESIFRTQRNIQGELYQIIAYPSSVFNGNIFVTAVSRSAIERNNRREMILMALLMLCIITQIAAGAYSLCMDLVSPLVEMSSALNRIAHGDLNVKIALARRDELGDASATINLMTSYLREKRTLSCFVAPQTLEILGNDLQMMSIGQRQNATVLVCDIRNFTTLTERFPPDAIFQFLNEHIDEMTRVITEFDGAVDRFIGDAIIAVFYSLQGEDHCIRALNSAFKMMSVHDNICKRRRIRGDFEYDIGIGIECGSVISGVVGDKEVRLDFTVMGGPLQTAEELEGLAKGCSNTRIIVSDNVRLTLGDVGYAFLPVAGASNAWEIAEISCDAKSAASPTVHDKPDASDKSSSANISGKLSGKMFPEAGFHTPNGGKIAYKNFTGFLPLISRVLLWLLPMITINVSLNKFEENLVQNEVHRTTHELHDNFAEMENILDPNLGVMKLVRSRLAQAVKSSSHSGDKGSLSQAKSTREMIALEMIRALTDLKHIIPGLDCAYLSYESGIGTLDDLPPFSPGFLKIVKRYGFSGLDDSFVEKLAASKLLQLVNDFRNQSHYPYWKSAEVFDEWLTNVLPVFTGEPDKLRNFWQKSLGNTSPVWPDNNLKMVIWLPIFKSLREDKSASVRRTLFFHIDNYLKSIDKRSALKQFESELAGMVQLYFPPISDWPQHARNFITTTFEQKGIYVAIVDSRTGKAKLSQDSPFRFDSRLMSLLKAPVAGTISTGNWICFGGNSKSSDETPLYVVLAKYRRLNPIIHKMRIFFNVLIVFWIAWGLYEILTGINILYEFGFKLSGRLTGAFILAMIPAFFVGVLTFERFGWTEKSQLENRARQELTKTAEAMDLGHRIVEGWTFPMLSHRFESEKLRHELANMDPNEGNYTQCLESLLNGLLAEILKRGLFLRRIILSDNLGNIKFIYTNNEDKGTRNETQEKLFGMYLSGGLRKIIPSETGMDQTKHALMMSGVDEFNESISFLMTPQEIARLTLTPISLGKWSTSDFRQDYIFRKLIVIEEKGFAFNLDWHPIVIDQFNIRSWNRLGRYFHFDDRRFTAFSPRACPGLKFSSPFFAFNTRSLVDNEGLDKFYTWNQSPTDEIVEIAAITNKAHFSRISQNDENYVFLAFPSQSSERNIHQVGISLDDKYMQINNLMNRQRYYLIAFLILVIFLARRAAKRFLSPVAILSTAAEQIMQGNFNVRLPDNWHGEFSTLADAFNRMAREAEEGRLLGRFVSDSVRALARKAQIPDDTSLLPSSTDTGSYPRATSSSNRRAVILFAGLSEFKNIVKTSKPESLIRMLNHYLKKMSGIIREHNGEIDKFIGDKILAVFHADTHGNIESAVKNSIRAGIRMLRVNETMIPATGKNMGIGIVYGDVIAGVLGTPEVRLEYTVIGDTVNLASRLSMIAMDLPEGGIVVDTDTLNALPGDFLSKMNMNTEMLSVKRIKGKMREVEISLLKPLSNRNES